MKLTNDTIQLLTNFSNIQPNFVFNSGTQISTLAETRNIMAEAEIGGEFDTPFGIYDLGEFLSAMNLLGSPELNFGDSHVMMTSDSSSLKFNFADTSILTAKTKSITMPEPDLTFDLCQGNIEKIKKAAALMKNSTLSIKVENGDLVGQVTDPTNNASNVYSITLQKDIEGVSEDFDYHFLIDNLKILSGDYTVDITSKLISQWTAKDKKLKYWIALEKTSNGG
jgi:hypothetical protein